MRTCLCLWLYTLFLIKKWTQFSHEVACPHNRCFCLCVLQVVHRDLAARNMLIGLNKDGARLKRFLVKVGDFGLARQLDEDGVCHTSPDVGTHLHDIKFLKEFLTVLLMMKWYIRNVWVIKFLSIWTDLILSLWSETHSSVKKFKHFLHDIFCCLIPPPLKSPPPPRLKTANILHSKRPDQTRAAYRRGAPQASYDKRRHKNFF